MSNHRSPHRTRFHQDPLIGSDGTIKLFLFLQVIEEHIGDLEDIRLSEARLADIDAGRVSPLDWCEVWRSI